MRMALYRFTVIFLLIVTTMSNAEGKKKGKGNKNKNKKSSVTSETVIEKSKALKVEMDESKSNYLVWGSKEYIKTGYRTAPWIRDPFSESEKRFKLSGVISAELAFLNGKWVREGDLVEGYLVRLITENAVTLTKEAQVVNVSLK